MTFKIFTLFFFINIINLFGSDYLFDLPNKSLIRGDTVSVPLILFDGVIEDGSEISIELNYDVNNIFIDSVSLNLNSSIVGLKYKNKPDYEDYKNSSISISGTYNKVSDTLALLNIFPFAGPDLETKVSLTELSINGKIEEGTLENGVFSLEDIIINKFRDNLSNIKPNPFLYETFVDMTVNKTSNVEIYIYDLKGNMVSEYMGVSEKFEIKVLSDGLTIENKNMESGQYTIKIIPYRALVSNSFYILKVNIGSNSFQRKFIYLD